MNIRFLNESGIRQKQFLFRRAFEAAGTWRGIFEPSTVARLNGVQTYQEEECFYLIPDGVESTKKYRFLNYLENVPLMDASFLA